MGRFFPSPEPLAVQDRITFKLQFCAQHFKIAKLKRIADDLQAVFEKSECRKDGCVYMSINRVWIINDSIACSEISHKLLYWRKLIKCILV